MSSILSYLVFLGYHFPLASNGIISYFQHMIIHNDDENSIVEDITFLLLSFMVE
jgi:hypothetical protein